MRWRGAAMLWAALAAACTPTFDWREVRPEGSAVRALFPCRPATQERSIVLAGTPVQMRMLACSAAEIVHALSFADMADPARVGPALEEMARTARGNVRTAPGGARQQAAAISGMTPHPAASQWRLTGTMPDGRAVEERVVFFSRGTRVFQATMLGPRLDEQAQEQFFGGLAVEP